MTAKEAQGRDVLETPYSLTIYLMDGRTITIAEATTPWDDFLRSLRSWHGISLETGFTPISAIVHIERTVKKCIVKDAPIVSANAGGNVIAFAARRK